jgi:hypothetical protein
MTEPGLITCKQFLCATELTESDDTSRKALGALGQGAYGRAVAAIEASGDVNGAVALDLSEQFWSDNRSVQAYLFHFRR